jgi:uncharacterized protein (TIRG00374 family)
MQSAPAAGMWRVLRIAVAVGLTALLLWWSDPAQVVAVAAQADWRWLVGAVALVMIDRVLMAWRWMLLLPDAIVQRTGMRALLRIFFVSTFVGTFLPGSIGGDAVRAWQLSSHDVSAPTAIASVVTDRLLGVAALILMAVAAVVLIGNVRDDGRVILSVAIAAAGALAAAVVLLSERAAALSLRWMPWLPGAAGRAAGAVFDAMRAYRSRKGLVLVVLAASLGVNVLRVLQAWMLGRGLAIDAPASVYFAFVPLILLVMLLPVSINGIGTSQAGFVLFFARAGVPGAESFALSVLYLGLGVIGNIPGSILFATRGSAAPAQR